MTPDPPARRSPGPGLVVRVFLAMGLVILAGAGTLMAVSLLLAPTIFQGHLARAGVPQADAALARHVEEGFAVATVASTTVGVVAALVVAAAGAALVARRIGDSITRIGRTTGKLADGDYTARVEQPRMGPELAALADAVNGLAGRLEGAEQARIRLIADLAHELRTPVAAIEATVEAIADGVLPADARAWDTLTGQAQRLARLTEDLQAVSRAEEHAFGVALSTVDLADVARACQLAASAGYARAGVGLAVSAAQDVRVRADRGRLVEVLDQLLANAVAHTPAGGRVTIGVTRTAGWGKLAVSDTGSGFDPADTERLFQRFFRAEHARAGGPGNGIGLTIARALVEAQGGTLTAASEGPGRGATFTVTLPPAT